MATARTGATIRNAGRGPPFIVVNHELSYVVATRWPGRLWCVEVVDPATATDQAAVAGPPVPSAQYTRAVAVQVGEELPGSMLFGPHGDAISTIIDAARELNAEQAAKLSASRHPEAERAYNRVWDAWLRDRGMPGPDAKDGLDGTLAMSGFRPTSPINSGLTVLYNELLRRAALLSGNAATETDGDILGSSTPSAVQVRPCLRRRSRWVRRASREARMARYSPSLGWPSEDSGEAPWNRGQRTIVSALWHA